MAGTCAGADAGSRASHWAACYNAVVAGAAEVGGDGNEYAAAVTGEAAVGGAAAAAACDAAMVSAPGVFDSGSFQTYCGNYSSSAARWGYSCSSTDSQDEACLVGLPQRTGGSFQRPHSVGTVHDPGSGAVTEAAPSRQPAASGASRVPQSCPWRDRTEGVRPTSSHSQRRSDGGYSHGRKELLEGGNQAHWTRVQ